MPNLFSIAIRVAQVEAMAAFYSEAFGIQFREVKTYGIPSKFGELNGMTLKLVPIRDETDFQGFPIHQPGFLVDDVQKVIDIAVKHGGRPEGRILHAEGKIQAAIRDPDGNTIELYSEQ